MNNALLTFLAKLFLWAVFWYGSIFIHELGHLLAALLVKFKPLFLSVGYGCRRTIFKMGDMNWQLGLNPWGGLTRAIALNPKHYRFRCFILFSGGIMTTTCVFLVLAQFVLIPSHLNSLPEQWQHTLVAFFIFELLILASCVIPHDIRIEGRLLSSDGKQLWKLIWMKKEDVLRRSANDIHLVGRMYMEKGMFSEAKEIFTKNKSLFGLNFWINCLIGVGKKEEAKAETDRMIAEASDAKSRVETLDSIACLPVYFDRQELLGDALRYIEEAIALEPEAITLKGTKGSLLVDQGDFDEGIKLLEEVLNNSSASHDKEVSEYFLALAYYKKNDSQKCHKYLNAGLARNPNSSVRWRVEREIKGQPKIKPWDFVTGVESLEIRL